MRAWNENNSIQTYEDPCTFTKHVTFVHICSVNTECLGRPAHALAWIRLYKNLILTLNPQWENVGSFDIQRHNLPAASLHNSHRHIAFHKLSEYFIPLVHSSCVFRPNKCVCTHLQTHAQTRSSFLLIRSWKHSLCLRLEKMSWRLTLSLLKKGLSETKGQNLCYFSTQNRKVYFAI